MIRLLVVGLALAGLAAGCGLGSAARQGEAEAQPAQASPPQRKAPRKPARPRSTRVFVTVVDGDTHERVRGARVRIGPRRGRSGRDGVAALRIRRRAALPVTISARGYSTRTLRLPFRTRLRATVRVYRLSGNGSRLLLHGYSRLYAVEPAR